MDSGYNKAKESSSKIGGGDNEANEMKRKCCADCRTTTTPLWRGGPSGPKSLCNACGIRHRKKTVSAMHLSKRTERNKTERTQSHNLGDNDDTISSTISKATTTATTTESLKVKMNLMASLVKKQRCRRKKGELGEEEQAAVLLMALSSGSVFWL